MLTDVFKFILRSLCLNNSILKTYNRSNLYFERGKGSWLETLTGELYLDFGSGIAVNSLGHCHPKLVEAIKKQSEELWHTSNLHNIVQQEKLADFLVANTFAEKVFFTNSGAESVECAIKMARKYFYDKGFKSKNKIITLEGSFHGRTLGTIAAAAEEKLTMGFGPNLQGFEKIPFGSLENLQDFVKEDTAAILVEPIQGEGGIKCLGANLIKTLRKVCDQNGILLIFDEVQCGVGRVGRLFAHEKYGVYPDIMAIAKGLGGGFPIGACLATNNAAIGMTKGTHGSTYGGNPLACAVANAVLNEITKEGFLAEVRRKSIILRQELSRLIDQFPEIYTEMRGEGLMMGMKCGVENVTVIEAGYKEGILFVAASENIIRILPPLNVSDKDLKMGINKLEGIAISLKKKINHDAK